MMWSAARPLREEGEGVLRRRGGALAHGDALEREHRRRRGRSLGAALLARAAAAGAAARLRLRLGGRLRIGGSVTQPAPARAEQCPHAPQRAWRASRRVRAPPRPPPAERMRCSVQAGHDADHGTDACGTDAEREAATRGPNHNTYHDVSRWPPVACRIATEGATHMSSSQPAQRRRPGRCLTAESCPALLAPLAAPRSRPPGAQPRAPGPAPRRPRRAGWRARARAAVLRQRSHHRVR